MADIRADALHYLGPRMRTKEELVQHLSVKKGWPLEEAVLTAKQLQEAGYLDDVTYASVFAEKGRRKGKAMKRLRLELVRLGVSEPDISQGFARMEEFWGEGEFATEGERCRMEARKLLGECVPDQKALARAGRKLASLGYDSESIYVVLGEYMDKGKFNGTV